MSDIFISWGSPDADAVRRLCSRLCDLGLDLFNYEQDMDAGDRIPDRIRDEIRKAKAGVVCLSDETAKRQWVLTEVAWLDDAYHNGTLRAIIPVRVGPLDPANIPVLIKGRDLYIYDPSSAGDMDRGFHKIAVDVHKQMGEEAPIVLPAVILAMTKAQFGELAGQIGQNQALLALCLHLGMKDTPLLCDALATRYGDQPHDFAPFDQQKVLVDTAAEAIRQINLQRAATHQPPLLLRWLNSDLFGGDVQRRNEARDLWESGALLVIDSISIFHQKVRAQFDDLPQADPNRTAVLWIPPYTQHTATLEAKTAQAAALVNRLGDCYRDWVDRDRHRKKAPPRRCTFSLTTDTMLWHWLYGVLSQFTEPMPARSQVDAMNERFPSSGMRTAAFFK